MIGCNDQRLVPSQTEDSASDGGAEVRGRPVHVRPAGGAGRRGRQERQAGTAGRNGWQEGQAGKAGRSFSGGFRERRVHDIVGMRKSLNFYLRCTGPWVPMVRLKSPGINFLFLPEIP